MKKKNFRKDFPIFKKEFDPKGIVYLDSASTSLKPKEVIDRVVRFYEKETSNVSRGNHFLSEQIAQAIEEVRTLTANFIKANPYDIVFTYNATDSINIVANCLNLSKDDEVIVSILEHHSNFLPWLEKASIKVVDIDENGEIDLSLLKDLISKKTKLISITYASNITGNIQPVEKIIKIAKEKNIPTLVDATQAIAHFSIDVRKLDCDYLVFSSHKMFGPSGVGILYANKKAQSRLFPFKYGSGMADKVYNNKASYKEFPYMLEVGTLNIEGILGFGSAIEYINKNGLNLISSQLHFLDQYMKEELSTLDFVSPLSVSSQNHLPIFTIIPKQKSSDIKNLAQMLSDSHKIIVRGGFQCSQLLYNKENLSGGIRASLHVYNNKQDIDKFIEALDQLKCFFA